MIPLFQEWLPASMLEVQGIICAVLLGYTSIIAAINYYKAGALKDRMAGEFAMLCTAFAVVALINAYIAVAILVLFYMLALFLVVFVVVSLFVEGVWTDGYKFFRHGFSHIFGSMFKGIRLSFSSLFGKLRGLGKSNDGSE